MAAWLDVISAAGAVATTGLEVGAGGAGGALATAGMEVGAGDAVTTAGSEVIRATTAGTEMIGACADVTTAGLEMLCACGAVAVIGGGKVTGAALDVIGAGTGDVAVTMGGGEVPRARVTAASRKMEGSAVNR